MTASEEPAIDSEPAKKKREYKEMEEKHEGDLHAKVDMNTVSSTLVALLASFVLFIPLFGLKSFFPNLAYIPDPVHRYRPVRQGQGRYRARRHGGGLPAPPM